MQTPVFKRRLTRPSGTARIRKSCRRREDINPVFRSFQAHGAHVMSSSPKSDLTYVILAALAVGVVVVLLFSPQQQVGDLAAGEQAPPIQAMGWVNGTPPGGEDLAGQVIVVEAWATWCGPCRVHAPHMVETFERFRDQGVVFIGLTNEDESALPQIEAFLAEMAITWPNGYGAFETLTALGAEYIPSMWVIGRDGKIAWSGDARGGLDEAIERALAQAY